MEGVEGMVKVPSPLLSQSISVITDDKVLRANLSLFSGKAAKIILFRHWFFSCQFLKDNFYIEK